MTTISYTDATDTSLDSRLSRRHKPAVFFRLVRRLLREYLFAVGGMIYHHLSPPPPPSCHLDRLAKSPSPSQPFIITVVVVIFSFRIHYPRGRGKCGGKGAMDDDAAGRGKGLAGDRKVRRWRRAHHACKGRTREEKQNSQTHTSNHAIEGRVSQPSTSLFIILSRPAHQMFSLKKSKYRWRQY